MNPVLRGLAIYIFLLIVFRFMGKRSLSDTTTFDFVLLLIISEVTQQALVGRDYSISGSFILILTLVTVDLMLSILKNKFKPFARILEGASLIIVEHGKPMKQRMQKSRVDEEDILESARLHFGLERMDQIKYAILERDGTITIIPYGKDK